MFMNTKISCIVISNICAHRHIPYHATTFHYIQHITAHYMTLHDITYTYLQIHPSQTTDSKLHSNSSFTFMNGRNIYVASLHTQMPNAYSHFVRKQNFAYMAYLQLAFAMMKVQLIPKRGPKRTQLCVRV